MLENNKLKHFAKYFDFTPKSKICRLQVLYETIFKIDYVRHSLAALRTNLKICVLTQFCGCPYEIKKIVLPPLNALLGHPVQNIFCFNQKIFLKPLVKIIFRYNFFFLEFWDSLRPPYEQNEIFLHMMYRVSKQGKRVCGVHF